MPTYKISKKGSNPSRDIPETIEARSVQEEGHEGRWLVFLDGQRNELLRVRSADIGVVTRQ